MGTQVYNSELDNKPIIGGGWFDSIKKGIEAARISVGQAPGPVFVAVVTDRDVVHRVAADDHPDAEFADELVEVSRQH